MNDFTIRNLRIAPPLPHAQFSKCAPASRRSHTNVYPMQSIGLKLSVATMLVSYECRFVIGVASKNLQLVSSRLDLLTDSREAQVEHRGVQNVAHRAAKRSGSSMEIRKAAISSVPVSPWPAATRSVQSLSRPSPAAIELFLVFVSGMLMLHHTLRLSSQRWRRHARSGVYH